MLRPALKAGLSAPCHTSFLQERAWSHPVRMCFEGGSEQLVPSRSRLRLVHVRPSVNAFGANRLPLFCG